MSRSPNGTTGSRRPAVDGPTAVPTPASDAPPVRRLPPRRVGV
ncbi:hypothetical protein [Halohasta salina]|nr:hypothetical protein [Halohasta salina]